MHGHDTALDRLSFGERMALLQMTQRRKPQVHASHAVDYVAVALTRIARAQPLQQGRLNLDGSCRNVNHTASVLAKICLNPKLGERCKPRANARAHSQADAGTRTPDPFITSEVLYQLSYVGAVDNDGISRR